MDRVVTLITKKKRFCASWIYQCGTSL